MLSDNTRKYFEQPDLWNREIYEYQKQVLNDILDILPEDITSILDAGCGDGLITNALPEKLNVVGLDISEEALNYVNRPKFKASITNIPFPDNSFDMVMANDVIEHLSSSDRELALSEIARVANRYVIITVPFMEDLNIATTKCQDCGEFYHLNHHFASFNIPALNSLLNTKGYQCSKQILTGDTWNTELPEAVFLKRLLGLEYPASDDAVCPNCGSGKTEVPQENEQLTIEIDKMVANRHCMNPDDLYLLRTECISIYGKNRSQELPPESGFIDLQGSAVDLQSKEIFNNTIDFTRAEIYRKNFLPQIAFLPYFIGGEINAGNVEVIENQSIKLGFFCTPNNNDKELYLELSGKACDSSEIRISLYDDKSTYRSPIIIAVNGEINLSIPLPAAAWSRYGFLFDIGVTRGTINIFKVMVNNVVSRKIQIFDNTGDQARYFRLPLPEPVYLSLPFYGANIYMLNWMKDTVSQPSLVNNNYKLLKNSSLSTLLEGLLESQGEITSFFYKNLQRLEEHFYRTQDYDDLIVQYVSTQENYNLKLSEYEKLLQEKQQIEQEYDDLSIKYNHIKLLYSKTLKSWIRSRVRLMGRGTYEPFESYKREVLSYAEPDMVDDINNASVGRRSYLMICHDQNIDRRIIQEAHVLEEDGWKGRIVALSYNNEDTLDSCEGIPVHRIGLKHVIPDCPVYWHYQNRYRLLNWWGRHIDSLSRLNWLLYKLQLIFKYKSRQIYYPLPFNQAFYEAAKHYPATLVFAHDLPALKAGITLAKEWGSKIIYDAHELYYEQKVFSHCQKRLMRKVESELLPQCDQVFTVNESIAGEMALRYGCDNIAVLLNAINPPDDFDLLVKPDYLRKRFAIPKDKFILLFQGGLSEHRNLEKLVLAMCYVTNPLVVLVIMGNGPLLPKLQKLVNNRRLQDKVLFKEAVPQNVLLQWTASADAGIIPYPHVDLNTYYCTPNKLFEFIQAGVPILANDLPELRRFVLDNNFGIIYKMTSSRLIASGIDEISSNEKKLKSWRENLVEKRERFAWSSEKTDYITRIRKIMDYRHEN